MAGGNILTEEELLNKDLVGRTLLAIGQSEDGEYDYKGLIERAFRSEDGLFLVFEVSKFSHRREQDDPWKLLKERSVIRIKSPPDASYQEMIEGACFIFHSKDGQGPGDVRSFIIH